MAPAVTSSRSRFRRDQLVAATIMVLALVAVYILQAALTPLRTDLVRPKQLQHGQWVTQQENTDALQQLSVEFPRLTLGGFRGLLAMVLWQQAEDDKNERRWVDLNTRYGYIGKLQPSFVSVYIFNAWNQAYNLSAQWHSVDEKFKWVLEGLDHLYLGEEYNPRNPDLLLEISQMYFLKIGTSFERIDYRRYWRDHIAHQYQLEGKEKSPGNVRDTHQQVRDVLARPQFNCELLPDINDPSKKGYGIRVLSGLKVAADGQTPVPVDFRYGLSPFYFAYCEYKRCLAAGDPTTTRSTITRAYPAMSLRLWCRDDTFYTMQLTREMFIDPDAPARANKPLPDARILELRDCYRNVPMVGKMALDEFDRYLGQIKTEYGENSGQYRLSLNTHKKHMLETEFLITIADAEHDMVEGLIAWYGNGQRQMTPVAQDHLVKSLAKFDAAIASMETYLNSIYPKAADGQRSPDAEDFVAYQRALTQRQQGVRALLTLDPGKPADLGFLRVNTVEE